MSASYEWDVEEVEAESEDIAEHWFQPNFARAKALAGMKPSDGCFYRIVLVRDGANGRSWAYLNDDGTMPTRFKDAYGVELTKVPARFLKEVELAST